MIKKIYIHAVLSNRCYGGGIPQDKMFKLIKKTWKVPMEIGGRQKIIKNYSLLKTKKLIEHTKLDYNKEKINCYIIVLNSGIDHTYKLLNRSNLRQSLLFTYYGEAKYSKALIDKFYLELENTFNNTFDFLKYANNAKKPALFIYVGIIYTAWKLTRYTTKKFFAILYKFTSDIKKPEYIITANTDGKNKTTLRFNELKRLKLTGTILYHDCCFNPRKIAIQCNKIKINEKNNSTFNDLFIIKINYNNLITNININNNDNIIENLTSLTEKEYLLHIQNIFNFNQIT